MKYYLPTSTLNFTCIAASRSIAPAACYSGWKLGWNNFATCEPNPRQDCLFVYDKLPCWQTREGVKADYPLLIELDESLLEVRSGVQLKLPDGCGNVRVCVVNRPVFLKSGLYRFIFKNESERREILPRLVGVPEFKNYRHDHPSRISVLVEALAETVGTFDFAAEMRGELDAVVNGLALNLDSVKNELGEAERTMGATLGFRLGQWLGNKDGENDMSPVEPLLDGVAWMSELNPAVKDVLASAIKLQGRPFPESSAEKVELAAQWGRECLKTTMGSRVMETFRAHFNAFLMNLQDPLGNPYRISEEKSPLIQSMAAVFYAMGKDADTISNLIKRENILSPEIFLALYGAVRGYTRFPNSLLSRDVYVVQDEPKQGELWPSNPGKVETNGVPNCNKPGAVGVGLKAVVETFLMGLSFSGASVGTDSHLALYVVAWAKMHDVQDAEKAGTIVRMFQDELRKSLCRGKKPKKEPAPKTLIKKLCNAMTAPCKIIKGWGLSKDLVKLLKADLEFRYTHKK